MAGCDFRGCGAGDVSPLLGTGASRGTSAGVRAMAEAGTVVVAAPLHM